MKILRAFFLSATIIAISCAKHKCSTADKKCQPEQIHISFGLKPNQIWVTWSTLKDTDQPYVEYCNVKSCQKKKGISTLFVDGGSLRNKQTIHRCLLDDLEYNTTYQYEAGSNYGMSKQFTFTTVPKGDEWTVHALIFGDLGLKNGVSLPLMIADARENHYVMAFHIGDIAYNMDDNNGIAGNKFMNKIQPLAASIPYMVCPGNHDKKYYYSHYRNRFTMPLFEKFDNYFYSFNLGPAHFISISTEVYYHPDGWPAKIYNKPTPSIMTQYNWLVDDLKEANQTKNRQKHPWIIMMGHRPMICSDKTSGAQCRKMEYPQRIGLPNNIGYGLEVLLKDYGVDLAIWGHEHSNNGSKEPPYTNPGAPVHVTTGTAGSKERLDYFFSDPHEWSAYRSSEYGYGRLHIYNRTHLHVEQVSTNAYLRLDETIETKDLQDNDYVSYPDTPKAPNVLDEFWVVKYSHEAYHNIPSSSVSAESIFCPFMAAAQLFWQNQ